MARRLTSPSRKYVYVIMLILRSDVDSHTYLVYTNYTDTCVSHFILTIYKNRPARMNQKYINQDANESEINKINTVFTDGIQQTRWSSTIQQGKIGGGE